jgi:CrcB protein
VTGVLLVAAGAAFGAPLRWWVDQQVQRRFLPVLPWGTFGVNVVGSLCLGLLVGSSSVAAGSSAYLAVGVGFFGALTTFSSFAWETHRLAEDGAELMATVNVVGSVLGCLAAAAAGWWLASAW